MKTGIYVPLIMPFKENGEVDYEGLAKATRFVLEKGADGIYACGSSSEFFLLTLEERMKCLEVIIANADGKEVIAHVGAQATEQAVILAKHAEKAGASMLSAVAPYYFGYTFPQIQEYFYKIAHATRLSLMIYNAAQARVYTLEEMKALLADEKISAMKYTGNNFYFLERLIKAFPEKNFYTGADEVFLSGQAVGAHGAIGTSFNYFADKYIQARQLFLEGKNAKALAIVRKINDVIESVLSVNNLLSATKYVMRLQGLDVAPISRQPFSPLTDKDKAIIEQAYKNTKF